MRLLKSEERKTYQIDWEEEVKQYFKEELSALYTEDTCEKLAEQAKEQIQICGYNDLVISLKDNYYVIRDMQLIQVSLNDEILPKSNLENPFLSEIFERKNWQDCITYAKPEANDLPLIRVDNNGVSDLKTFDLDKELSKYFVSLDLKESVKIQLMETMADTIGVLFSEQKDRYVIYKDSDRLEVKKVEQEREKIRDIILSAFHMIESEPYEMLICKLCNTLIYGDEWLVPIEIYDMLESEKGRIFIRKGVWHYKGKKYKFFTLGDGVYAIVPKNEICKIESRKFKIESYTWMNNVMKNNGFKVPFDFNEENEILIRLLHKE